MSNPRRRIVRVPAASPGRNGPQHPRQIQRLRGRLERVRQALARWLVRRKRAFNAFIKHQQSIARLERQLAKLEE